jgi:thiamine kinase-like enzyme
MSTHGDLTPWNVIIHKGKIAAIIDWEFSGWRPDYWEYTKAYYNPIGTPQEWFDALGRAMGRYDKHLKGERCLWVAHEFPAVLLNILGK